MAEFKQWIHDTPFGSPPLIGKRLTPEEWLAYIEPYRFGTVTPDRIVLHHTWSPNEKNWAGLASMKAMQRYYAKKGWSAAPHIYTAPDGIWLFTPLNKVGIHAGLGNAGYKKGQLQWYSIGVEMVGFFDKVRPAGSVWENTLVVLGSLCRKFERTPEKAIGFHRDFTNEKSCPGWAVTKPWVFSEVNRWMTNQSAPAPTIWEVEITAVPYLRVRQGRGTEFPEAGRLRFGERVQVDDDTDGWLHLANGLGFIYKEFTRKTG